MKHWHFTLVGFSIFTLSHLALIPILSFYGLNVCPILQEHGFYFGCQFATRFVLGAMGLQLFFIFSSFKFFQYCDRLKVSTKSFLNYFPYVSLLVHFFNFFYMNNLYSEELSQVTEKSNLVQQFLWVCISLILVVSWQWIEVETIYWTRIWNPKFEKDVSSLFILWFKEQFGKLLQLIGILAFFSSYIYLILLSGKDSEIDLQFIAEQKAKFLYLFGILLTWQFVLFAFEFYKNKYFIEHIGIHLKNLQNQNLKYKSNITFSGFFGFIFNILNQFSETLHKKNKLMKGLSTFVSENVAHDILEKELHSQAGVQKKVVILMADIREFTTLSSTMDPSDVVELLNTYFSDMLEVFLKNDVVLDKFIGDGILAYIPIEESEMNQKLQSAAHESLLKAAFEMQTKLLHTNAKLKNKKLPKIQIGIGLHEGSVILGSIGSQQKLQYTIIGDPVNVAARLEGLCKEHLVGVVASQIFLSKVSSDSQLKFISLGKQKIRGIELPLEVLGALPYEKKSIAA